MASADRSTLFINATILDGSEHMEPQPDMAVTVERGVITWMGPSAVAQAPAGAEVIDLGGAYLMPGLINMHVHLCGSGKPVSAGDAGALMKKLDNPVGRAIVCRILKGSAQQQLASGVTTVRGAGDPLFADIAVRDAIDAGKYQGPRLVAPRARSSRDVRPALPALSARRCRLCCSIRRRPIRLTRKRRTATSCARALSRVLVRRWMPALRWAWARTQAARS